MRVLILVSIVLFSFSSCMKKSINISKHDYKKNKREGFWFFRTRKAISYNQNVIKPKRDRDMKKLARENKSRERFNTRNNKRYGDNETLHKTYDHH